MPRALRPGGRLAVVSLQPDRPPSPMTWLYLAVRRHLPDLLDCRPIPVPGLLTGAGWHLRARQWLSVAGLPASAVTASPAPIPSPHLSGASRARPGGWWPALTAAEQSFSILNIRAANDDLKAAAVIREAAMRLFADRGAAAVTVREIAAAAGVSPGLSMSSKKATAWRSTASFSPSFDP